LLLVFLYIVLSQHFSFLFIFSFSVHHSFLFLFYPGQKNFFSFSSLSNKQGVGKGDKVDMLPSEIATLKIFSLNSIEF